MEQAKELDKVLSYMKENYHWDISKTPDPDLCEALVSYAIHAIKELYINTPQNIDFSESVKSEMAHHLERWGDESFKSLHHFNMVLTYINGKLAKAIWEKDIAKTEHHLITISAIAGTMYKYLNQNESQIKKWFKL